MGSTMGPTAIWYELLAVKHPRNVGRALPFQLCAFTFDFSLIRAAHEAPLCF